MSATWFQQPSSFLCVVDDGQQHPHLHSSTHHHPATNYDNASSCSTNLTAVPHNMNSNYSWVCGNFSTFEDFSQYYDSHQQQHYQGSPVTNELTAVVPELTNTCTIHPEGARQNTKGRQRNRRTDKKKDIVLERKNNKTQNISNKIEEDTVYDNKDDAADGCVYVRAKRGQAIDSHSLAERVRRQKISEKMKLLQSIVPGCDKISGKIPTLDNIIDYIHSLQDQVKSLMTDIALVDPTFDVNYLALESIVTHLESSYATTEGSECTRIASQYHQSIPLCGSSAQAVSALPSPWLALLEDREYTI